MKITTAVMALALGAASTASSQTAHTHWEPYKNSAARPSVDQKLTDRVLDGAIDLHAHYGPDAQVKVSVRDGAGVEVLNGLDSHVRRRRLQFCVHRPAGRGAG